MADCVALRQSSGYNDISFDIKRYDPNLPSLYIDNEQQYNNVKQKIQQARNQLSNLRNALDGAVAVLEAQGCSASSVGANAIYGELERLENGISQNESTLETIWEGLREKEAPVNVEEPPAETAPETADNAADDDSTPPTVTGENQKQDVVPESGAPTTAAGGGSNSPGSAASPGPAAKGGVDEFPGRRTYNPLSKLSSYTYNLTLYMITPDAYDAFIQSGRQKIDILSQAQPIGEGQTVGAGAYVVAQSGGINNNVFSRAPGFELDYYIDNVSYNTLTSDTSGIAFFRGYLKMTITEPYGFSFLSNLRRTLEGLKAYSKTTGYGDMTNGLNQFFILGIRFYGYDANGNLIKGTDELYGEQIDPGNSTTSLFERFYDMHLQQCKFTLSGKAGTVYNLEFSPVATMQGIGQKRSRVTTGARVIGETVKDMLVGKDGLLTKLNKEQEEQVNKKVRKLPNIFELKFMDEAEKRIGAASMVLDSDLAKYRWPGSKAQNTTDVNDNAGIKAVPESKARELVFNTDTQIVRAIGSIIMKSQFMEKAMKTVYNNVVQPDPKQKSIVQTVNNEPNQLSWYTISTEVSEPKWDTQINDWAYKTTYIITLYEVPCINSPFTSNVYKYYGPHKYFYYWLTGQNTEVLDFQLNINNAYFNTVTVPPKNDTDVSGLPLGTSTGQTAITPMTQSGGDTTSAVGVGQAAQAAVETVLYDPSAFTEGKIVVLGDPDFIMRDQVSSVDSLYKKFYDTDQFTASAHGGMVFVELVLKESKDYKNSVGLQEINESIQFYPYPKSVRDVAKGIIYYVQDVTSNFANGKFVQTLNVKGAHEWPNEESQDTPSGDTREQEAQASAGNGSTSGASSGAGNGTTDSSGLREEPKPPVEQPQNLATTPPSTNTIGNETPGTITSDGEQVADDDSISSDSISFQNTISKEEDNGREFVDNLTIPTRVKVDPIGPPDV